MNKIIYPKEMEYRMKEEARKAYIKECITEIFACIVFSAFMVMSYLVMCLL